MVSWGRPWPAGTPVRTTPARGQVDIATFGSRSHIGIILKHSSERRHLSNSGMGLLQCHEDCMLLQLWSELCTYLVIIR